VAAQNCAATGLPPACQSDCPSRHRFGCKQPSGHSQRGPAL